MATEFFQVPTALVTVVGENETWFSARCGIERDKVDRDVSMCQYTILTHDVLAIEDMQSDARFASNPLVVSEPFLRFYAGAPLSGAPSVRLGSLCLIDTKPRRFTNLDRARLKSLA